MALRDLQKPKRIIKLYHGSPCRNIDKFDLSYSRESFLDFGKGIYFTTNESQAMLWSIKHSDFGAVYEVDLDVSNFSIKQYLSYSDKFIETFCFCRAGLEMEISDILGYDGIYGFVIDNNKAEIIKKTNDYVLGLISASSVRNTIKVFDNKDQLCIKSQNILNNMEIKRVRFTEYVQGYPRNRLEAVKWTKKI